MIAKWRQTCLQQLKHYIFSLANRHVNDYDGDTWHMTEKTLTINHHGAV